MNETKRAGYRRVIWQVLCDEGALTAREIQARLGGRSLGGIRPRLTELGKAGEIRDTGERRGGGRRGPREKVWEIVHAFNEPAQPELSLAEEYGVG